MSGPGEKLTHRQERAVLALLTERNIGKAAARAKVGESTLRRWLSTPVFLAAYRAARRQAVEHAIGQVQHSASLAAATLRRALPGGKCGDRIRAALGILGRAVDAVELGDVLERLERLEALVRGKHK
jgi:hypothetical protein